VIGSKKLATIRQKLQRALTATGDDPIRWLEGRTTVAKKERPAALGEGEVLRSLRRFVESSRRTGRRKRSVTYKKSGDSTGLASISACSRAR
jgi:hypothetical protein